MGLIWIKEVTFISFNIARLKNGWSGVLATLPTGHKKTPIGVRTFQMAPIILRALRFLINFVILAGGFALAFWILSKMPTLFEWLGTWF